MARIKPRQTAGSLSASPVWRRYTASRPWYDCCGRGAIDPTLCQEIDHRSTEMNPTPDNAPAEARDKVASAQVAKRGRLLALAAGVVGMFLGLTIALGTMRPLRRRRRTGRTFVRGPRSPRGRFFRRAQPGSPNRALLPSRAEQAPRRATSSRAPKLCRRSSSMWPARSNPPW